MLTYFVHLIVIVDIGTEWIKSVAESMVIHVRGKSCRYLSIMYKSLIFTRLGPQIPALAFLKPLSFVVVLY